MVKNERNLTVSDAPGTKGNARIPRITLQGRWLEALGFEVGNPIVVCIFQNNNKTTLTIKHR